MLAPIGSSVDDGGIFVQVLMQMANYAEYAEAQHDEEPLYIFDR